MKIYFWLIGATETARSKPIRFRSAIITQLSPSLSVSVHAVGSAYRQGEGCIFVSPSACSRSDTFSAYPRFIPLVRTAFDDEVVSRRVYLLLTWVFFFSLCGFRLSASTPSQHCRPIIIIILSSCETMARFHCRQYYPYGFRRKCRQSLVHALRFRSRRRSTNVEYDSIHY